MTERPPPQASIDSGILDALYQLSQRYYRHGVYEQSASLLEFLVRHQPMSASFHLALGKAWHAQSMHEQAVLGYDRALKLGMPGIDVHFYLGQCLIFLGRLERAASSLQQFYSLACAMTSSSGIAEQARQTEHLLMHLVLPKLNADRVSRATDRQHPQEAQGGPLKPRHEPMET